MTKKVWYFIYCPDPEYPNEETIYAVADSKEYKERFIRERGCKNMRVEKVTDEESIREILYDPDAYNLLGEYKVGLTREGKEVTLLMTRSEHRECMSTLSHIEYLHSRKTFIKPQLFKSKYRKALEFINSWPVSLLTIILEELGETFT